MGFKIAIASDHGGFHLKALFIPFLKELGHEVHNLGTHPEVTADYPDFAEAVSREVMARSNPAALLSLMWYHATGGCGKKDMVILPYKDRLQLLMHHPVLSGHGRSA